MRIAVLSDIHGNRAAFEAVLADLRETSPDLILHGGDLADSGASPVEILDRICDLGWPGVVGNTDEMLFRPESLQEFAMESPAMQPLAATIEEMAAWTREQLGEKRLQWLRDLPRLQGHGTIALVHASPGSLWRAPAPNASDAELQATYRPLGKPVVIHGHTHRPYVRSMAELTVANAGSVGLCHDGDTRAAYLLVDDFTPSIRRVEYDLDSELHALSACSLPHSKWIAKMISTGSPQMP